jgi:hypothetical protein
VGQCADWRDFTMVTFEAGADLYSLYKRPYDFNNWWPLVSSFISLAGAVAILESEAIAQAKAKVSA